MLKIFSKIVKDERGQIGQILVVVILIVLAVLGVSKFIMPAFNTGSDLAGSSLQKLETIASQLDESIKFKQGETFSGSYLAYFINQYAQYNVVMVVKTGTYSDDYTGTTVEGKEAQDPTIKSTGRNINPYATYVLTEVKEALNKQIQGYEFTLQ